MKLWRLRTVWLVTAIMVLAACAPLTVQDTASSSSVSATISAPTTNEPAVVVVGGDRPVTVQVPPGRDLAGAPLLLVLHRMGGSGSEAENYFRLGSAADERGMVYAYPDGTVDSDGIRFWNATDACCDFDQTNVDDEAYLAGLIDEIGTRVTIDPSRVYLMGHSNGGFMSYRMACSHADMIAAVVSLGAATFATPADCAPSEPVAILEIHGTADDIVRFGGGSLTELSTPSKPIVAAAYPSVSETIAAWINYDGCSEPEPSSAVVDVDAGIDGSSTPAEATIEAWADCDPGGHVELWTIPNGGHNPVLSVAFSGVVLDYLLAHPKP